MGDALDLGAIQKEMLKVALKIDEICNLLGIRYCLGYGSLIGAIRHNGFIPWDDDLDVWMTKKDLDVFSDYCESHAEEIKPFKLCTQGNAKNYPFYIPRFSNMNFRYVNTNPHMAPFDIGVFVDIYPIEAYGNSQSEAERLRKKCNRYSVLYDIYVNPNCQSSYVKAVLKKGISWFLHLMYPHEYDLVQEKKLNSYIKKHETADSKYVGCVRWNFNSATTYNREDVFDSNGELNIIKHNFSGVELNIPKYYDAILRRTYGDYMKLPPEDKRHATHDYDIFRR